MSELVFLKLGGSFITDKRRYETARPPVIARAAKEIAAALQARPDLHLVLGHGSGSFGHFVADKYRVRDGFLADWRGVAETSAAAQRLNRMVVEALLAEGVRVVSVQPSASARCRDGVLQELATAPIAAMLEHGAVPLVYGDVAVDDVRGCTIISTEQVLAHLARALRPQRVILVSEVAGVYSGDPNRDAVVRLIPEISPANYAEVETMLTTSFGVDVTGGMLSKVQTLYAVAREQPELMVHLITGRRNRLIEQVLVDAALREGTCMHG